MGPGLSLGSTGNYPCDPYLLQITVSSTEKGMLKFHESILHTFSMLHSSIFLLNVCMNRIQLWSRDQFDMGYLGFKFRVWKVK